MNYRRLAIVLTVFVLVILGLVLYTQGRAQQRAERAAGQDAADTRPADSAPAEEGEAAPPAEADSDADPEDTEAEDAEAREPEDEPRPTTRPADGAEDEPAEDEDEHEDEGEADDTPAKEPADPGGWKWTQSPDTYRVTLGSLDRDSGYLLEAELHRQGAGIGIVRLTHYYETVADKRLAEEDPEAYAKTLEEAMSKPEDQREYHGHYKVLTPMYGQEIPYKSLATARVTLRTDKRRQSFPVRQTAWMLLSEPDPARAVFACRLKRRLPAGPDGSPGAVVPYLEIRKTFELDKNDYSIRTSVTFENLLTDELLRPRDETERPNGRKGGDDPEQRHLAEDTIQALLEEGTSMEVSLEQLGPTGVTQEDRRDDGRHAGVGRVEVEEGVVEVELTKPHELLEGKQVGERAVPGGSTGEEPIAWIGIVNKYFGSLCYLVPHEEQDEGKLYAASYSAEFFFERTKYGYVTGTAVPWRKAAPGTPQTIRWDTFAGPKRRSIFSGEGGLPARPLYRELSYRDTVNTRSCFCVIGPLTRGLMWLLDRLSFINYGVAIILLVAMVRLVLHPLTKKGQVSMMKMQKMAPQMQALKEKYKDDKETLNREMMKMYKQQGATPVLGCLPMILQMPIWIALFTGLNSAVELRHAAFLPVWITDLAAPDALIPFGSGIDVPLLGWTPGLNLLPILVAIAMVLNMKMNPQSQMASGGGDQAKQQKMMMYIMPVMMLFIFYNMPSGLNLYIMTSTFAGVAEQKIIRKHIREREEAEAARETTVSVPGKKPRSQRPKKPKGPNWFKQG